jgi:nicotinamide-nucleotide adenylyltransferase
MMAISARELSTQVSPTPSVYIGIIKCPYFLDKAAAISSSEEFPSNPEQVYLIGYDTLVRIMDPKYYPPAHNLAALDPFMRNHRLRVTLRPNDGWGSRDDQEAYLQMLAQGGLETEGGKKEWVERIELVEGQTNGEAVISSTTAREAAQKGDDELLRKMVTDGVANWIIERRLYRDHV